LGTDLDAHWSRSEFETSPESVAPVPGEIPVTDEEEHPFGDLPDAYREIDIAPAHAEPSAEADVEVAAPASESPLPAPAPRRAANVPLEQKLASHARKWLRDFLEYQPGDRREG
jgi:hypothetical protein